ncbi:MAG TPA: transporter [Candidatus Krumholzibacteria bacterium]|nr:transporter [Candidatus Krumholzibacteria bacterium]
MQKHIAAWVTILLLLSTFAVRPSRAQTLETETARFPPRGAWDFGSAFEYQFSSSGSETAFPVALEYGLNERFELMLEPVLYTAIDPSDSGPGEHATGFGDVEATLSYLLANEGARAPALALAGEVKAPSARNDLIGTGHTDITGYLILSKRLGGLDTHANLSYTVLGHPADVPLNNIFGFALAGEYRSGARLGFFGEVLGNTAASPEGDSAEGSTGGENAVVAEAPGGELVGTLGAGVFVHSNFFVSLAVSYDNNQAVLLRPGFVVRFR